ncbi:hypothetical protein ACFFQW_33575 [Umezawaea endophytica]|uniref:Uncharacterized protein n=1 Tax=Umezawaea endophytica TaxID=1654476 RepID=A0A9X2VS17_9PSEU|nr:hypothetical protein [Umezawaea endophytica]MCS7480503.1 hypothetical protein [Umezawaea endophytica]
MHEARELSRWLAPLREVLLRHGYRRSYLGGSGAREILDHLRFGTALSPRDVDLYVLKHATVRAADVHALRADLRALGEVGPPREKLRAGPSGVRVVGAGVHVYRRGRPILSVGVLHHAADLALNGLFDVDTILLDVDNARPRTPCAVLDPHDGYRAWRDRSPRIVHWAEVERCFTRNAFRIVRTLGKADLLRLPEDLADGYRRRRPPTPVVDDPPDLHRDLLKVLGDRHWAEELAMLAELDALTPVSASLQARIAATTPTALRAAVPTPADASPTDLARLRAETLCGRSALLDALLATAPLVFGAH